MATIDTFDTKPAIRPGFGPAIPRNDFDGEDRAIASSPLAAAGVLASLKLSVVLLSMLLFLVLAGTAAQVEYGIWYVVREGYFRVWWAWIEFQAFVDLFNAFRSPETKIAFDSNAGFYFPGGYLIGMAMAINLMAAHVLRFKIVASGSRLMGGIMTLVLGVLGVTWVAFNWLDETQVGQLSESTTYWLWFGVKASVVAIAAAGAMWLVSRYEKLRLADWLLLAGVDALLMAVAGGLWLGDWTIPPEAMRIVWMLAQGISAGAVVLAGCWLVFDRRAGVVLLHAGVLLLMGHEFYTGMAADESQMRINEGQTINYSVDSRKAELVFIDRTNPDHDTQVVVSDDRLRRAANRDEVISDPRLPVDIQVVEYYDNSELKAGESDNATVGAGKFIAVAPIKTVSGLAMGGVDIPSAYVKLLDKSDGKSLGTYLVSTAFDETLLVPGSRLANFSSQPVELGKKSVDVGLRLRRIYRPFSFTLLDFRFDRYPGTNTPRNFSSDIRIDDPDHAARTVTISMNNPLRYRGETYYQQSYDEATEKATVLQVAKNEGYMLPYISCAIVLLGMVWHFGTMLGRFLSRRGNQGETATESTFSFATVAAPALAAAATLGFFAYVMMPVGDTEGQMHIQAFGELPVLDSGRVKPFDTLALNTLQYLSARQVAPRKVPKELTDGTKQKQESIPATQWLLDLISGKPEALDYPVFRIENLEVLEQLKLEPRPKFYRYSFHEIDEHFEPIARTAVEAMRKDKAGIEVSTFEQKAIEIYQKWTLFVQLRVSFMAPHFGDAETAANDIRRAMAQADELRSTGAPRAIIPNDADGPWRTAFEASLMEPYYAMQKLPGNPAVPAMRELLSAYRNNKIGDFNAAVAKLKQEAFSYERELNAPDNSEFVASLKTSDRLRMDMLGREKWLNDSELFYNAALMYFCAFLLASFSFLGARKTLGRAALAVIVVTLLVHTFAIWQRTEISGRPPITNLYDTTICVGWACVLLGVVFDVIYRLGIGSFVAAGVGFCTLLIGHFLSQDGDTFTVLQAVLDTNFWLATHVISINLGYATSVLAGCLGIAWVLLNQVFGALDKKEEQQLSRMIYGTVCFAILFSFVGTVLGGLWADDSWGRFWGWDPKENGALMVVLWNAVILHARWGGVARPRGVALLAIFGNIITAWSWFGTNGLGIGLHAYGFRDGTAQMLLLFWVCNLAVIGLSFVPWESIRGKQQV